MNGKNEDDDVKKGLKDIFGFLGAPKRQALSAEDEIKDFVADSDDLLDDEKRMIHEILDLGDMDAGEIMTPRVDMILVEGTETVRQAVDRMMGTGYSRLPVFQGDIDRIVGVVHYKDLVPPVLDGHGDDLAVDYAFEPLFVPESKDVFPLLAEMQTKRQQMAIVVDEYGGTDGLITVEDILEEIVGEIGDETDVEDGKYVCGWAIEKMSKSFYNVVNPDYIVDNYGADTLRMYEMFLGPLEQSKPWDTNGIDGVHKFLRRFWRLFFDRDGQLCVTDEKATEQELRTLHKTIKKVSEDIENFSFNTSVAAFMICLNELGECSKREVLEPLTVLLAPFAPHIAEELWAALGHTESVCTASYPVCDETHLVRNSFEYPVSVNGKLRFRKEYAASMTPAEIQADVVTAPEAQKWLEGKTPKKIIVVPGKIINIVI